jgi:hypothetical protein
MEIHHVFHISLLEPYHASTIPRKVSKSLSPIEINGEQKYKMEKKLLIKKYQMISCYTSFSSKVVM